MQAALVTRERSSDVQDLRLLDVAPWPMGLQRPELWRPNPASKTLPCRGYPSAVLSAWCNVEENAKGVPAIEVVDLLYPWQPRGQATNLRFY